MGAVPVLTVTSIETVDLTGYVPPPGRSIEAVSGADTMQLAPPLAEFVPRLAVAFTE